MNRDQNDTDPNDQLLLGHHDGQPCTIPTQDLLRHAIVLGASGSGKTVLLKILIEEAVLRGVPSIVLDSQGDLSSLALTGSINRYVESGLDPKPFMDLIERADVQIWTPGSTAGIPISVSPLSFSLSQDQREEDRIRMFAVTATGIASMVGMEGSDEAVAAISLCLEWAVRSGCEIQNLANFAKLLEEPPADLAPILGSFFSDRERQKVARKLYAKLVGPARLLFQLGQPINIPILLGLDRRPRTRISIFNLSALTSQEERDFFVGHLASALYQWMLSNPSPRLQALFCLDEAAPYCPPVRKPASKQAIMMLLRQARKYGVGCIIGTQSAGDLDFVGLGQIGTWAIGKASTYQEAAKVQPVLRSQGLDGQDLIQELPQMQPGEFFLSNPSFRGIRRIRTRPLMTHHRTLELGELDGLVLPRHRERYS